MSKNTRNSTPAAVERVNANHKSNQGNANRGTNGTNQANAKVHGNRGAQKNPNRQGN